MARTHAAWAVAVGASAAIVSAAGPIWAPPPIGNTLQFQLEVENRFVTFAPRCHGIGSANAVVPITGKDATPRLTPGALVLSAIVCERPLTGGQLSWPSWREAVEAGDMRARALAYLRLHDESGTAIRSWRAVDAWPSRYEVRLSESDGVAIEELELVFDELHEVDETPTPDPDPPDSGTPDAGTPLPGSDAGTDGGAGIPADAGEPDAGIADAGVQDAGLTDAGQYDAGQYDAGQYDAGEYDAGEYDAGQYDAGAYDAGEHDAGEYDAGQYDAGAYDAGVYDAGAYDAGADDAGADDAGADDAGADDAGADDAGADDVGEPDAGANDAGVSGEDAGFDADAGSDEPTDAGVLQPDHDGGAGADGGTDGGDVPGCGGCGSSGNALVGLMGLLLWLAPRRRRSSGGTK